MTNSIIFSLIIIIGVFISVISSILLLIHSYKLIYKCDLRFNVFKNYKIITLCGSTKFKEEFLEVQKQLSLQGNIVISVGCFGHSGDNEVWNDGIKEMLDNMHKRKIDLADEIFVINKNGYIGESTKSEIEYAKKTGKTIKYYE